MSHLPLFQQYTLKGIPVKNRIIMPPMVCFGFGNKNGTVTPKNLDHYRERAEGGAGIVVVEATAVIPEGRIFPEQLGIWSDDQIDGLSKLAGTIKGFGAMALIQIHHAGLLSREEVTNTPGGPSENEKIMGSRALTIDEILLIRDAFVAAAKRARQAGFDGVEVHGAHGYLLSQFSSSFYNKRTDDFGGSLENRMRFPSAVIRDIREACGDSFVVAYRMGCNSPTLNDGREIARILDQLPVDLIDVSHGGSLVTLPRPPRDFDYNWIVYGGTEIKKEVEKPVAVVSEIRTPRRANFLIEQGFADFVNIGRPMLADPHWVNKAQHHEEMIVECINCRPRCKWYTDGNACPALKIREKGSTA
jgi:NADPH2 dehydrogenase